MENNDQPKTPEKTLTDIYHETLLAHGINMGIRDFMWAAHVDALETVAQHTLDRYTEERNKLPWGDEGIDEKIQGDERVTALEKELQEARSTVNVAIKLTTAYARRLGHQEALTWILKHALEFCRKHLSDKHRKRDVVETIEEAFVASSKLELTDKL